MYESLSLQIYILLALFDYYGLLFVLGKGNTTRRGISNDLVVIVKVEALHYYLLV